MSDDDVIRVGDVCYVLTVAVNKRWSQLHQNKYTNTECTVLEIGITMVMTAENVLLRSINGGLLYKVSLFDGHIAFFERNHLRKKRGWDGLSEIDKQQFLLDEIRDSNEDCREMHRRIQKIAEESGGSNALGD